MRTAIYNYISAVSKSQLGTYTVTQELPWDNNGTPLYLSNLKTIYVDVDQTTQNGLVAGLDGSGAVDEITTVRVFFANDAKTLPSNYETLVQLIKDARLISNTPGVTDRTCQVSTAFVADKLTTTFEFSFKKLITN